MNFQNYVHKLILVVTLSCGMIFNTGCISRLGNALATQKQAHTNMQGKISNHTYGPNNELLAPIPDMEFSVDSGVNSVISADKLYLNSPVLRSTIYTEGFFYSRDPAANQKMIAAQTEAAGQADANAGKTYVNLADTVGGYLERAYGFRMETKQKEIEADKEVEIANLITALEMHKLGVHGEGEHHEENHGSTSNTAPQSK